MEPKLFQHASAGFDLGNYYVNVSVNAKRQVSAAYPGGGEGMPPQSLEDAGQVSPENMASASPQVVGQIGDGKLLGAIVTLVTQISELLAKLGVKLP